LVNIFVTTTIVYTLPKFLPNYKCFKHYKQRLSKILPNRYIMLFAKLHDIGVDVRVKSSSEGCLQSEYVMDWKFSPECDSGGSFFLLLDWKVTITIIKIRTYPLHNIRKLSTCIRILLIVTSINKTIILPWMSMEITIET
jgi:hypothetical protein